MASDQVEYCGNCKRYSICKALAKEGKEVECEAVNEEDFKTA